MLLRKRMEVLKCLKRWNKKYDQEKVIEQVNGILERKGLAWTVWL